MSEQLLTVQQAASRLHLHPITVRRQLRNGNLRGVKRGGVWRVPEAALAEPSPHANQIWSDLTSGDDQRRGSAIKALAYAPERVRDAVLRRSGEAAACYYATPEGEAELADWRALDGEPFLDEDQELAC